MKKNIEMKIYEILGVKVFKKLVFAIANIIIMLFIRNKEKRKERLYHTANNYCIGELSLEAIKKFKKQLYMNAQLHAISLVYFIPDFLKFIGGIASLSASVIPLTCIVINLYCIMLQRYNCIRINQVIEKVELRKERQKNTIKQELKKDASLEHTKQIEDKKERETSKKIEYNKASIEQLKIYRKYLIYLKNCSNDQQLDSNTQVTKKLTLNQSKVHN